jgi:hypothetical protein
MQLTWPDEMRPFLEEQSSKANCASIDEYTLRIFLQANPESRRTLNIAPDELERELIAGVTSGPATPMTSADWVELRRQVESQLAQSSGS